jgi:HSP20 family protein
MKLFSKEKKPKIEVIDQETTVPKTAFDQYLDNEIDEEQFFDQEFEGQLAVDVFQTNGDIIIKSTIAGVKPDNLDITVNSDMVTIKGKREQEEEVKEDDYYYKECYWGGFSRSIILPEEIKTDKVKAQIKNGVLTITMPKLKGRSTAKVKVKEIED